MRIAATLCYIIILAFTSACVKDLTRVHDKEVNMTQGEYITALNKNAISKERKDGLAPPIPRLSKIVAMPANPKLKEERVISISANEDVPISDLIMEISRVAKVDIVIDKTIRGGLFIEMKNRPLREVLDRIAEMADLRYSEQNNTIVFEYDDPYLVTYNINFLNVARQSSSAMSVSTSVLSSGSISSGSSSSLSSTSADTFWSDMITDINQIIRSSSALSLQKRATNGKAVQVMGQNQANSTQIQAIGTNTGQTSVNQTSTTGTGGSTGSNSGSGSGSNGISLNKTAGTITIFANSKGHQKIGQYFELLKKKVTSQVLIEVKLVEVLLSKNFASGIDFSYLGKMVNGSVSASTGSLSTLSSSSLYIQGSKTSESGGTSLTNTLNFLDYFGTTKILASPRLMAINNQQAVLTFADNEVFFDIQATASAPVVSGNTGNNVVGSQLTITSSPKTIPVGIVLTLQPSIDIDKGTVLLNVRPTLSRIKSKVDDPGFTFLTKQNKVTDVPANQIPVTSVRELDSILNMKSGDIMIMGGFTERSATNTDTGVPYLSRIPLLGWFFSKKVEEYSMKEIVIMIKTTIIQDKSNVNEYDKYFYKTFFSDPREFDF